MTAESSVTAESSPARLSLAHLDRVASVHRPTYDPAAVTAGIVHLGIGAFSRGHLAAYCDAVIAAGDHRWGICGVSQRSNTVPEMLAPQDGLYTLLERDGVGASRARVIGSVRTLLSAAHDPRSVVNAISASTTSIVTLTVTEKGYRFDPVSRRLRADTDPALQQDLAGAPPTTAIGQIVRGLEARRLRDGRPIDVISLDNVTSNGELVRGLVFDFVDRLPRDIGGPLATWIVDHVGFPNTMVDRIVPKTVAADVAEAGALLGVADHAPVVAEPYTQWVIQDALRGVSPAWRDVGVTMSDDVGSYEQLKLRVLNATHSMVAYLGLLAGYPTIADALGDDRIASVARRLIDEDQAPTVAAPAGVDIAKYRDQVLERFSNHALGHTTLQVAMDGSQKLPQRLLGAVRERREAGGDARWATLLIAAWIRALTGPDDQGQPLQVDDPIAERVRALCDRVDDGQAIRKVMALTSVFGDDLGHDQHLVGSVVDWYGQLRRDGVRNTLA